MTFRYTDVFSLLVAILATTHFLSSNLEFVKFYIEEFKVISNLPVSIIANQYNTRLDGHHHHHHEKKAKVVDICDDFPRDSVPQDTNTTTTFCVDRNGCCNFTTIQSAIDATITANPKRTLIWINNGIYL